jgi:hypothetical protein
MLTTIPFRVRQQTSPLAAFRLLSSFRVAYSLVESSVSSVRNLRISFWLPLVSFELQPSPL